MAWTSGTIVSKIYGAVDETKRLDNQRLKQWTDLLRHRPANEVFEALVGVFCSSDRRETRFLDQEYAGRILLALKPPCSEDVQSVIRRALATWDYSVEQFPWYFSAVVGQLAVLRALDAIDAQAASREEREAVRTFRFWIHAAPDK